MGGPYKDPSLTEGATFYTAPSNKTMSIVFFDKTKYIYLSSIYRYLSPPDFNLGILVTVTIYFSHNT